MPMIQGFKGAGRVPAFQAAEDAQEHFLGHVLGVVPVAEQAHAQAVHFRLETPTSCRIASASPPRQRRTRVTSSTDTFGPRGL